MAVNYATTYSQIIDEKFSQESLTDIGINKDYEQDFNGSNKVMVYSMGTVPLNDYDVNAKSNRYGETVELGNDVQELTLTQDKSFSFTIDRKNNADTQMTISAARALERQINGVISPAIDKYRLEKIVDGAETANTKVETITTTNAYAAFLRGSTVLFDARVPVANRVAWVSPAYYELIKQDKNFTQSGDKAYETAVNGEIGTVDKTRIIPVPTSQLPTGVNFIITHPSVTTAPTKLTSYHIHEEPQGVDGWLIEGRIYFDAFVLDNKKSGIYVSKKA